MRATDLSSIPALLQSAVQGAESQISRILVETSLLPDIDIQQPFQTRADAGQPSTPVGALLTPRISFYIAGGSDPITMEPYGPLGQKYGSSGAGATASVVIGIGMLAVYGLVKLIQAAQE